MLLLWKVDYLDTRDREMKERSFWLVTDELDPVTKAAVELAHEMKGIRGEREMLKYRRLFREEALSGADLHALAERCGAVSSYALTDYVEDENGKELSSKEIAVIATGSPHAVMIPRGAKQHDLDYMFSEKRLIDLKKVTVRDDDLKVLAIFTRDMKELIASTFYSEGPGSLNSTGGKEPVIQTAVTDEEIRSFVTIFRRLYMVSEPAGFLKAVDAFVSSVPGFPLTEWVKGCAGDYAKMLDSPPDSIPFDWAKNVSFTRKNLIDVFIYTQYAHQPSADRLRQFNRYLNEVGNRKSLLSYLFLSELCGCTHKMSCAGKVIANFFDSYCRSHGVSTEIVDSLLKENPGVGKLEKKRDQENRLIREKTEEIAFKLWQERGRPSGGPVLFYDEARKRLATLMEEGLT